MRYNNRLIELAMKEGCIFAFTVERRSSFMISVLLYMLHHIEKGLFSLFSLSKDHYFVLLESFVWVECR